MLRRRVFEITMLLCLLLAGPPGRAAVWQQLTASGPCAVYRPLTAQQQRLAESLFTAMLGAERLDEPSLAAQWAELGYGPVAVPAAGDAWIGLRELGSTCHGQGFYLVNRRPGGSIVIQAPHAYHDLYSGEIAAGLLRDDVAIVGWNSTGRRVRGPDDQPADLARRQDSLFAALARALVAARPHGRLIQIHGFAGEQRRTAAAAAAAVIVSSGSRWPSAPVERIAACLRARLDSAVRVYPREVTELGATTNVQGQTLRRLGHAGFVHLELSRPTRENLRASPAALAALSDCLSSGLAA